MNKKTFLIIISCVTIVCIVVGACIHLRFAVPTFSSVRRSISRAVEESFDSIEDADEYGEYDFLPETHNFSSPIQEFDSIVIDAKVMGITVERANRFEISGTYAKEALKPSFSVSGGTLKITQPNNKVKLVTNGNCKIVITVPYGTKLDSADINVDVGAVALKGIDVEDAQINTDVGAIAIENVEFREIRANSDVGAVSVELAQPISEYNIDAKSDVGAIQVNGSNAKRKYSQTGSTNKRIKIKTDVGGIDIK